MDQLPVDPAERIRESVRHALRLVGPGELALQQSSDEGSPERPAAA